MSSHPDRNLTLRQAFEKHYDRSDFSNGTECTYRAMFKAWEKLTDDPPICEITDDVLAEFRQAAIDVPYMPRTVNTYWTHIRAILRRCGPKVTGNPRGLAIIDEVPWMKLVRVKKTIPKRIPLSDLSAFYVACRHAEFPRGSVHPADWWRALIVTAYFTALRRGDLFNLQWNQIDMKNGTVDFTARKTGKAAILPLHSCAVKHLERIRIAQRGDRVFRGLYNHGTSGLTRRWRHITDIAQLTDDRYFTMHDIRRTAASEIERVQRGMARELLQHSPTSVTDVSYLNVYDELRECIGKMRVPSGFNAGPKVAGKRYEDARKARVEMRQADFEIPSGADPRDWQFRTGAFCFRGTWYPMPGIQRLSLLRKLVETAEPVHWRDLVPIIFGTDSPTQKNIQRRVHASVSKVRQRLRKCFELPDSVDPVPCVAYGDGGSWTIWIPPEVNRQAKGGAA